MHSDGESAGRALCDDALTLRPPATFNLQVIGCFSGSTLVDDTECVCGESNLGGGGVA